MSITNENALAQNGLYRLGLMYGRNIYRLRWVIVLFWLIAVGVGLPFSSSLPNKLNSGGYEFSGSESYQAYNILAEKLHIAPSQLLVAFQADTTPVADPAYQREVNDFVLRARKFPHVTDVTTNGTGTDGRSTYVTISFNQTTDNVERQLDDFQRLLPSAPAHTYLTGDAAISNALVGISRQDTQKSEEIALPISFLALLIVFGTLLAGVLPILLAMITVPVSFSLIYIYASYNLTNVTVQSIVTVVGLGISIDYSLFMTRRFREELARGRTVPEAVAWTVTTAGEAILFSGCTVMIGFLGLIFIGIQSMTSLGIGGAIVVASAVLAALTLLPALLSIIGPRINSLRIPYLWRLTMPQLGQSTEQSHGFWHRLAFTVMKRPVTIVLLVSALLLALGWPVLSISLGTSSVTSLPETSPVRQGSDILNAQFPDYNAGQFYIVAQSTDGTSILSGNNLQSLSQLTNWLKTQKHLSQITSLVSIPTQPEALALSQQHLAALYTTGAYKQNPALARFVTSTTSGDTTLVSMKTDLTLDSAEGKQLINTLRSHDKAHAPHLKVLVGGIQGIYVDFDNFLYSHFPLAILFIMIATYVLLLLMFRSVLLPLKAILMNILSVSVAYGILVFVFQWGHFSGLLDFTSVGFVESQVPIMLFCALFGLSMDYEVFLLSRIREEWLKSGDNQWSVAHGLEQTGGVITNAALLFIIVTSAFTFTTLTVTKELGLGMTVAVFVDAAIIRTLLVPAAMQLLGRWNWWFPGRPLVPSNK